MIIDMNTEYITTDELRDSLYRDDKVLLLDCRTNEEYQAGHISGSHNIVLPQLMMRRLKANKLPLKSLVPPNYTHGKETFLNKCRTFRVILYDHHFVSDINDNDTSMLNLLHRRLIDESCSVAVLRGGYKAFQESHSEYCNVSTSIMSSNIDKENSKTDKSTKFTSGERFSPLSPLSGIAPSILGLGALQISNDSQNSDIQNSKYENQTNCHSTCLCPIQLNSQGESDEVQIVGSPKCLSRIKNKPPPISLSSCCTCEVDTSDVSYPSPCGYVNAAGPAEILPRLFLGCAKDASSEETLTKCKITYILNVTPNLPNVFEGNPNYKYKQIPITDHWSQNLSKFFPEAISFIDEARSNNCGILVHCLAGISRSVTLTVAYLMQKLKWTLNDAYDFVKQRKSNVSPNFNFMGQLLDFEKTLGVSDISSDDSASFSSVSSEASTPPTLFFTSPPPPTPRLKPIRNGSGSNIVERSAFIIPTTAA